MNINKKNIHRQQNTAVFLATVLIFSTLVTSSCHDASKNALDIIPEAVVTPAPYLGSWQLSKVFGKEGGEPITVVITKVDSGLTVTFIEEGLEGGLLLSKVSEDVVASFKHPHSNLWQILKITLDNGGNNMSVYNLNLQELNTAIESSSLAGSNDDFDDLSLLTITAEGAKIRNYIENNPNSFLTIPSLELKKCSL